MKNAMKIIGIIALVAVIGFAVSATLVSCDDGSGGPGGGGGGGSTNNPTGGGVSGTYYWLDWYITFSNGSFTGYDEGPLIRGTYSVNGSTITLSTWFYGRYWTIVNSNTVMDDGGDYWRKR